MTQYTSTSRRGALRKGDVIRADWLNDLSGESSRNARILDQIELQEPEGQDDDGTQIPVVLTEIAGTAVFGAVQRIEDASDPNVYIEVRNKIQISATDENGTAWTINLEDITQP